MGVVRVGFIAVCVSLLVATQASARIINAEGILPPGQSGFVALTGVLDGTGSPHAYDQQPLFIDFKRKPFQMNLPGTSESPRAGVSIRRDTFGVPAVYGDSDVDAWWGAGYAVAQDRLFELEAFRHATQGRLSELTGKGSLEDDLIARRDYYTTPELMQMFTKLPPAFQRRIEAYRDGINAWIAHVQANPLDLPGEYAATTTALTPWEIKDSLSIGIFLARTVPSGDGNELRNLRALQASSAKVLDELLPLSIKGQISTVPRPTASSPRAGRTRQEGTRGAQALAGVRGHAAARRRSPPRARDPGIGGSYMYAVRARAASARSSSTDRSSASPRPSCSSSSRSTRRASTSAASPRPASP